MNLIKTQPSASLLACFLYLLAAPAMADITEIPAEEMTESYIQDTTVIVPKNKQEPLDDINVTINPNEGNRDSELLGERPEPNNEGLKRPDLKPLSDDNLAKLQADSIRQQNSSLDVPLLNLNIQEYDNQLREQLRKNNISLESLGIPASGPIDYSKLQFPTGLLPNTPIPELPNGIGFDNSNSKQFILTIPNTQGYRPSTEQTPGGEYQVKVDNNNIQFIINAPRQ